MPDFSKFTWFDKPQTETQAHQRGGLSKIGTMLQGIAAPFGAAYDNDFGIRQLQLQAQQDQADMEFQKYLAQTQAKESPSPLVTVGSDGKLFSPYQDPAFQAYLAQGLIPPNAKFVPPATMETSGQKMQEAVTKSELTKSAEILPKMDQALEAVNMLQEQYYKGVTPPVVEKGDVAGGLKARASGVAQGAMAAAGANPDLNVYKSNRGAFASLISKGGFLEAGMLTNQDIERVLKAVPDEGSTKKEADVKWTEIRNILGKARQKYEKKLSEATGGEKKSKNDDKYQEYLKLIGGAQ